MSRYELIIAVGLAWLLALPVLAKAGEIEPILHLSFEKGLAPDKGGEQELKWSGKEPPQYYANGLTGKALLIDDNPARAGFISVPPAITDKVKQSGTLFFWVRGLENWDIFGTYGEKAPGAVFLSMGGGMIYKWSYYSAIALFGCGPTLFYPVFDQYQWTRIGVSWQSEEGGKTRNRIYLDGKMVGETSGKLDVGGLQLGGYPAQKGCRFLLDDLKIYDRVLTESEINQLYRRDMRLLNQPGVAIPRLQSPPKIDGKLNDDEWAGAAQITGLLEARTGEAAVDQSKFYLGYDDKFLYVAMLGDMTELARNNPAAVIEKFLRCERTGRDEKVDTDDAVEIILTPEYWKTEDHRAPGQWKEYRLLGNAVGAYSACAYGTDGVNPKWNVNWQSASTIGSGGWQFEARIPLDAFGAPAPVPGERWGMQLGRCWKQLKDEHDVWTWGVRFPADEKVSAKRCAPGGAPVEQPDTIQRMYLHQATNFPLSNLGVLQFAGEKTPVVRVEKTGNLGARQIDFRATLANPSALEQRVKVKLFTDTKAVIQAEDLILPAGGKKEFGRRQEITDLATSRLTFEVYDAATNLVHRTSAPFYLKQAFDVRVAQFPNYEKFVMDVNLGAMADVPAKELRVEVNLADKKGKTVYRKTWQAASYVERLEDSTRGFDYGDYVMAVAVCRGAKTLAVEKMSFVKKEKALWWNNRYGFEDVDLDIVPYPWTDMKVSGQRPEVRDQNSATNLPPDSISVWGRTYQFGNKLLPEQITTLDYPILRAPMRMVVKTADGQTLDTSAGEVKAEWTKTNRTRVEGRRVMDTGMFALKNTFWAEYDGLIWCTLTLAPKQKINIASMELELPLTREFTDVIKGIGVVGKLKPEGASGVWQNTWLGNGDGGIQWIAGDGKLLVKDNGKVMRVDGAPTGATLRITMINVPTELDAPFNIQFGLIATPLRPKITRTPFFRKRSLEGGGAFYPKGLESLPAADPGFDSYGYGSKMGRLYVWTSNASIAPDASGTEDFKYYGAEWMADPFQRPSRGWETDLIAPTGSKSFRDYFVWRHWRYQQKYGFGGLYYDNPSLGTLENREVMKRLYNITLSNRHLAARDAAIGLASNGGYNMAFGGFTAYQWDGEQLNSVINSQQPTYRGVLDPAAFRAEYMGHNYAWPVMFLGQGRIKREWVDANGGAEAVFDQVHGLALLHDGGAVCCILPGITRELAGRRQNDVQELGLNHWIYQFTPYWRQDIVKLTNENMHVSFYIAQPSKLAATNPNDQMGYPHGNRAVTFIHYFEERMPKYDGCLPGYIRAMNYNETEAARKEFSRMKDKVVMIVYNNTAWEGELRLKPDWKKLGLGAPAGLTASNYLHRTGFRVEKAKDKDGKEVEKAVFFDRPEEFAKIEGEELVFPMTKWNYRMIVLEKK